MIQDDLDVRNVQFLCIWRASHKDGDTQATQAMQAQSPGRPVELLFVQLRFIEKCDTPPLRHMDPFDPARNDDDFFYSYAYIDKRITGCKPMRWNRN